MNNIIFTKDLAKKKLIDMTTPAHKTIFELEMLMIAAARHGNVLENMELNTAHERGIL